MVKAVLPAGTLHRNQALTYTLAFSNSGPGTASGVVITDIVPTGVSVSAVVSSGVRITNSGATPPYVWQVQNLAPGARGFMR